MIELLTGILVLVTGYYAWTTTRILAANRDAVAAMHDQSDALTRPYVQPVLCVLPGAPIFVLKIRNTGRTTARNLRLSTDRSFRQFGKKDDISTLNAFRNPIQSFPPDAELSFWLATGPEMFGPSRDPESLPEVFVVTAKYEYGDKTVSEATTIDFRPFLDTDLPKEPLATELKEIARAVETVSANLKKV